MVLEFHRANLQGVDFKGKDLAGEDFSYADIRGANFSGATLVGANFSHAKAGIPTSWVASLTALVSILSLLAGLIASYAGALTANLLYENDSGLSLFGFVSLIMLIAFLSIMLWRGLGATLATLAEVTSACLIASIAFFPNNPSGDNLAIGAQFTALSLAGAVAGVGNMAVATTIAKVIALPRATVVTGFTAAIGIVLGGLLGVREDQAFPVTGLIAIAAVATGTYAGLQATAKAKKYSLIRTLSLIIVAYRGTSFRGADLTDADFSHALLKTTDFRHANLTRTCWFQSQKLDQARVEETYLETSKVRQLVTSKEGREQKFDRFDLRGLNLKEANLQDASFIGADLSQATLEYANLFGAKLVQTQLYKTNLTAACLTGAYIQDWGISINTQFNAVNCEYIYMQLPTREDPDPCRKPDNRSEIFQPGDFADFITPIIKMLDLYRTQNIDLRRMAGTFKTLDLFHYQGIDPTAAAIALQQLIEEYPEAGLEVVALEGRGNEKIHLKAVVSGNTNRSKLSTEYFSRYRQIKSLSYPDLQTLLAGVTEKDERIRSLEKLLENALKQPKFYVETYQNQGEFSMSQSKGNVNISGVQGNVSGVAAAGENQTLIGSTIGAVSGSVTQTINQLPESTDPNKLGIKELLAQLQAEIEAESELSDEDKVEALEQVKTLAEAGQKPEDNILQKAAKTAMKILKGTVAGLPDAAKLAEACAKLLPAIATLLALA